MTELRSVTRCYLILAGLVGALSLCAQTPLATDVGPVASSAAVQVTLHLAPGAAKLAALDALLAAQQDETSRGYHRWLTPAEFRAQFAPDASQAAAVKAYAESAGMEVGAISASGLRVNLTGTEAQVEAAFAPALHNFMVGGAVVAQKTATVRVPFRLQANVMAVGKIVPVASAAVSTGDVLDGLTDAAESGASRWAAASGLCAANVTAEYAAAVSLAAKEASAQGATLVAAKNCAGGLGFPANLPEVAAVVIGNGGAYVAGSALRPSWQVASGLPQDGLRAVPDFAVSSLNELMQGLAAISAELPANADGSTARLGNINPVLYALATVPGLYAHSDDAAAGTWEASTGLGLLSVPRMVQVYPRGNLTVNVSITSSNYAPTHGQSITLTSVVSDTSGQGGGVAPTGTVTFTTSGGVTLGSGNLVNGSASVTLNSLAGGTYSVTANYSGDSNYAANHSVAANISVIGEATALSATVAGSVPVGGQITVNAVAKSSSGVGTPTGTVQVQPQGVSNSGTYTGTLSGSNGTATATVTLPATQAGNIILLVSCVSSDPSFTCYTPVSVTVTVTQATSNTSLSLTPNPPVAGQTTTFTATVTGAASPAPLPTGNVNFYDFGTLLGTGTLTNGTANYTNSSLTGTTQHAFTATYAGDGNYTASTSAGTTTTASQGPTTTTLTIAPNPPVYGTTTTLTATVGYTSIGTFPTGTVTFFQDGTQVGVAAVASNGAATFTSTTISGTQSHVFSAKYNGDTNYAVSTSANLSTQSGSAVATTTTLAIAPNPPVNGTQTTLTATVGYTSNGAAPTGTVQFYEDGSVIGSGVVNSAGAATFASSTLSATTVHSFFAKYLGDVNYQGSQSNSVTTQVGTGGTVATNTTVAASSTMVNTGGNVTLTATVVPQTSGNTNALTGTVAFTSSAQGALGTATVTGGTASITVPLTMAGTQNISATYSGDANYQTSTSSTPVTITVATQTSPLTLTLSPLSAGYGGAVTAVAAVTGVTVTSGAGPAGTVTFAISGGTTSPATVALTPSSVSAANASYTFAAPAPGTYTVSATCTGTNFTCSATPATATLVVGKGNTTTTLTATPAVPVAGAATLLTATIAPASTVAGSTTPSFSGMVTFYVNGTSVGTSMVTGNQAIFSTTLNATATNIVTAVYSGDANYNTSTSTPLSLTTPPVATTGTLTSNLGTALQGSLVIFTAGVSVTPTTANPTPGTPSGTIAFYDTYNGQQVLLGTAALVASGPYLAIAQLSTTGLFHGKHNVVALYAATSTYAATTTSALTITITDYSLSFTPANLTLSRGQTGTAVLTVTALDGFKGTVTLGCTPPADTSTTCVFNPTVLSGGGTSTLTITTTVTHSAGSVQARLRGTGLGVSFTAGLACLLWPRKRRPMLLALVVLAGLLGAAGCGTQLNNTGTPGSPITGTPLGTQAFTIVSSGADGVTTTRHNLTFQVTVQ